MTLIEVSLNTKPFSINSLDACSLIICLISHSDANLQATIANRARAFSLLLHLKMIFFHLFLFGSKAKIIVCS